MRKGYRLACLVVGAAVLLALLLATPTWFMVSVLAVWAARLLAAGYRAFRQRVGEDWPA